MPWTYEHPHPAVAVDIVVVDEQDGAPRILLVKRAGEPFAGMWALPGGFVGIDEALEQAARRELEEETGLDVAEVEQLHTFGEPGRDPRERVISVVYMTRVAARDKALAAAGDAADVRWFSLDALPELAFDHADILRCASARIDA